MLKFQIVIVWPVLFQRWNNLRTTQKLQNKSFTIPCFIGSYVCISFYNNSVMIIVTNILGEDNALFRNDLEGLCNTVANDAANILSGTEQKLVRSEVTLQNAVTTLKSLNVSSNILKNKVDSMLSANFLPNVKVDK